MPIIRNGVVYAGVGGGKGLVSIDGTVPPALVEVWGGSPQPLDDDTILFNGSIDGQRWGIVAYARSTGVPRMFLDLSPNTLVAAGRVWAAHKDGFGYFDSRGFAPAPESPERPRTGPHTWGAPVISPDGVMTVVHENPQDVGSLLLVHMVSLNGIDELRIDDLTGSIPNPLEVCANDLTVLYRDARDRRLKVWGALTEPVIPRQDDYGCLFVPLVQGGRVLVIGYGNDGLFLQPWSNPTRAILIESGEANNPSVEIMADGTVAVVAAARSGETPESLTRYEFDLAKNLRRWIEVQSGLTSPWTAIEHVDLTQPMLPSVTVPPFSESVYVAPYFATNNTEAAKERGNHDHPGNAEILTNETDVRDMARLRPFFLDEGSYLATREDPLAWAIVKPLLRGFTSHWLEGGLHDRPNIERTRALALEHGVWHVVYSDTDDYPTEALDWLNPRFESPMIRCYPAFRETPDQRAVRVAENMMRVSKRGFRPSVALPFYTQSENWPLADVLAGLDTTLAVVEAYDGELLVMGCFAYARGFGMKHYPPLMDVFERLCTAVPSGVPRLPDIPTPTPTPTPPDWEEPMPFQDGPERDNALTAAGAIAAGIAKTTGLDPVKARQWVREGNDAIREASKGADGQITMDGQPAEWVQLSLAKAGGTSDAELQAYAKLVVSLRRR